VAEQDTVEAPPVLTEDGFAVTEEITGGKFMGKKELELELKMGRIELSFSGKRALEKIGWLK